jgi:cellulose synthase (UDP-forming)
MSRVQRLTYLGLIGIGIMFVVRFGIYWFNPSRVLMPHSYGSRCLDVGLFVMLTFIVWQRQLIETVTWWVCRAIREEAAPPAPRAGLRVAIITTFVPGAEPVEMLERTLSAMIEVDYPHDTWVLDEGNDSAVQALCVYLGVDYFTRAGRPEYNTEGGIYARKTKGGNHNAWYAENAQHYDFVAQFDTDFIAHPKFLTRTLGHFADETVAFVGTPQVYGNTASSLIARGAAQQTFLFYGAIMRGFGKRGMALLIGANHVVRVRALAEIGYYVAHLTEDLATGMTFHSNRWRSVYVPEILLVGEGPTTWQSYFSQQYRWAFGCIDLLIMRTSRLISRMRPKPAAMYPLLQTFYFNGLALGMGALLLAIYFITGHEPARISMHDILVFYAPLLAWRQLIVLWLQRFNVDPSRESGLLWAGRLLTIAAMPIYFLAFVGVVRRRRMSFKVTPKGREATPTRRGITAFRPHLALATVSLTGAAVGFFLHHTAWPLMSWAVSTAALMLALPATVVAATWMAQLRSRLSKLTYGQLVHSQTVSHRLQSSFGRTLETAGELNSD